MIYQSRRNDLDPSLCLDVMQGRIYENDRAVKDLHVVWGLDPENPRVIIRVTEMPEHWSNERPKRQKKPVST